MIATRMITGTLNR